MNTSPTESQRDAGASCSFKPDLVPMTQLIRSGDPQGQEALNAIFGKGVRFFLRRSLGIQDVEYLAREVLTEVSDAIRCGAVGDSEVTPYVRMTLRSFVVGVKGGDEMRNYESAVSQSQRKGAAQVLRSLRPIEREALVRYYSSFQSRDVICGKWN
jgi:hypothetical protein